MTTSWKADSVSKKILSRTWGVSIRIWGCPSVLGSAYLYLGIVFPCVVRGSRGLGMSARSGKDPSSPGDVYPVWGMSIHVWKMIFHMWVEASRAQTYQIVYGKWFPGPGKRFRGWKESSEAGKCLPRLGNVFPHVDRDLPGTFSAFFLQKNLFTPKSF